MRCDCELGVVGVHAFGGIGIVGLLLVSHREEFLGES